VLTTQHPLTAKVVWCRNLRILLWKSIVLTTQHPLTSKVGANFADKRQSLGWYSLLVDTRPWSLFYGMKKNMPPPPFMTLDVLVVVLSRLLSLWM
jgi:hypothetical protein